MSTNTWNDFQTVSRLIANVGRKEPCDTYCGRPGPWGNPFQIDSATTRQQAVEQHQQWLNGLIKAGELTISQLAALTHSTHDKPRTLGCYCSPLLCHCHTLARYSLAAQQGKQQLATAMRQSTTQWYAEHDGQEPGNQAQLQLAVPKPKSPIPSSMGDTDIQNTTVRSILTAQKGRVSFVGAYDYTINPYQGCSAACDYCYAAGYTGNVELSKTWGLWVKAKSNAAQALTTEAHLLDGARIYMATVTDPYQPVERLAEITAAILDVMAAHTPRLVVQTRFPLVVRDIPRFQAIVANGGMVQVNVTVTTDDDDLRRIMEPKCPSIPARIRALTTLSAAGITACATVTPMLPVQHPVEFARRLRDTGIEQVIIQDFHQSKGSGEQFRRSTRPAALQWLQENWGDNWRSPYNDQYRAVRAALQETFPDHVGEGQKGFAPPF